jgi:hypothetical protein
MAAKRSAYAKHSALARDLVLLDERREALLSYRSAWRGQLSSWLMHRHHYGCLPEGVDEAGVRELRRSIAAVCFELNLDKLARRYLARGYRG